MEMNDVLEKLNKKIELHPEDKDAYMERGIYYYGLNEFGPAINDFNHVIEIEPDNVSAKEYLNMIQEILAFRYTDLYNP